MLERGVGDGEVALNFFGLEDREAAEGAGVEAVCCRAKRVDVVVHKALKGVETLGAGGVEKGDAGGGGERGAGWG